MEVGGSDGLTSRLKVEDDLVPSILLDEKLLPRRWIHRDGLPQRFRDRFLLVLSFGGEKSGLGGRKAGWPMFGERRKGGGGGGGEASELEGWWFLNGGLGRSQETRKLVREYGMISA